MGAQVGQKRNRSWEELQNRPTRVLFVRNVAEVTPDRQLAQLCARFGPVTQILQMVEKRSAFIEFEVFEHANDCINAFKFQPPTLDGRQLQFAFSGRDKIKMPDIPFPKSNPPSRVLHLQVSNIKYQVTVDVCKRLMGNALEKVSIREPLSGEGIVNILCQISDLPASEELRKTLDGKYIYTGCNRIAATYSHLQLLEVPQNNSFAHDFTKPVTSTSPAPEAGLLGGDPTHDIISHTAIPGTRAPTPTHGDATPGTLPGLSAPTKQITEWKDGVAVTRTVVDLDGLASASPMNQSISFSRNPSPMLGSTTPTAQSTELNFTSGTYTKTAPVVASSIATPPAHMNAELLITGLNENTTVQELANLTAVYGNVLQVKIIAHNPSMGTVRLATQEQARAAIKHLDNVNLKGSRVRVELSDGGIDNSPGSQTDPRYNLIVANNREYTRHPLDKPLRSFPPSTALFVMNLPVDITKQEIIAKVYERSGRQPVECAFTSDMKAINMHFATVDDALDVLVHFHLLFS